MFAKFKERSRDIEVMDNLNCSGAVVDQTLRELEIINRLLGGNKVTVQGISQLLANNNTKKPVTIADLGCGGGDMLKMIHAWGIKNKLALILHGLDANPNIIRFAAENTDKALNIEYQIQNVLNDQFFEKKYDIVLATLFMHHFNEEQLVLLFSKLCKQAQIGIVINDLHRHGIAYYAIRVLTMIFSRSSMVKFDGPLSVLRGFSKVDLESILLKARVGHYSLKWKWAFRWQLVIPSRHHT